MRRLPRRARLPDAASWRLAVARMTAVLTGGAVVLALAGWHLASTPSVTTLDGGSAGQVAGHGAIPPVSTTAHSRFSGIILPDLLIVLPRGLTTAKLTKLRAIDGVRKMISFDGAQIMLNQTPASVIGVNPDQFRSWVPLRTASDQRLWTALDKGDFIASATSAVRLAFGGKRAAYQLTGASRVSVRYGGAAQLSITGVDLVVNQAVSRKLGLIHQVAALISAPGVDFATLTAKVRRVLGRAARLVDLRGRPASAPTPASIASYLQLFQASSAKYCPALSWTVLAAIGQIESADGQNVGPSSAGALGPMQFLPSTWSEWGIDGFGPPGPPDIMNPFDAVPSAARMLCADGASSGTESGLRQAVFAYNHADWYVNEVLALAARYAAQYPAT
ncbi:MAG TPA: lytic transglycosylase domain-containing protein [Streptosporangiaceae bacterium]|nr:lytic transglycosylase domain-containing protein [Streptosporangiaceae bacterium]